MVDNDFIRGQPCPHSAAVPASGFSTMLEPSQVQVLTWVCIEPKKPLGLRDLWGGVSLYSPAALVLKMRSGGT